MKKINKLNKLKLDKKKISILNSDKMITVKGGAGRSWFPTSCHTR
ncbi:class I lanthipeptide [Aquimarina longa]